MIELYYIIPYFLFHLAYTDMHFCGYVCVLRPGHPRQKSETTRDSSKRQRHQHNDSEDEDGAANDAGRPKCAVNACAVDAARKCMLRIIMSFYWRNMYLHTLKKTHTDTQKQDDAVASVRASENRPVLQTAHSA